MLTQDSSLVLGHLTLLVDGVADTLQIAEMRDNAVNVPTMSSVLRPTVEVAGQLAWMLDDTIEGEERGRRYLIWRFHDLRQQRHLLSRFTEDAEANEAADRELDDHEAHLLQAASDAGWDAKASVVHANGDREAAALLDRNGEKTAPFPKASSLVSLISSNPNVYGFLSVPTHGYRFGVIHGMTEAGVGTEGEKTTANLAGFGLPPNLGIGLACLCLDRPGRLLGGWNGVDASILHEQARRVMRLAGFSV